MCHLTANAERLHETAEGFLFTQVKAMMTVRLGKKLSVLTFYLLKELL